MPWKFLGDLNISRKDFFIVSFLIINALSWYYLALNTIDEILISSFPEASEIKIFILSTFYIAIVASGFVGLFLSKRVNRLKFFSTWIIAGAITSTFPAFFMSFDTISAFFISIFLGASFGIGMPSCLAYFAERSTFENRGRIGGIILLITFLFVPFIGNLGDLSLRHSAIIMAIWRSMGLAIVLFKPNENPITEKKKISFSSIIRDRPFLLYFVAWLMFSLLDKFEKRIVGTYLLSTRPELFEVMDAVEPLVAGLFIIIAGFLCDSNGRKKIVLLGFAALGIAYGLIGFIPTEVFSWYFYFIVDV